MLTIRQAADRGHFDHGWLDTYHSFSFGRYYDPEQMGFGSLRVINEDTVAPGRGFDTHGHRDMEIITYVLDGALRHQDSMGNGSVIRPGDVQRMSAGTGVTHSEYNASSEEPVHLLQIWIEPAQVGIEPGYEETIFADDEKQGRLRLIGSRDGRHGSVTIHQAVDLYATRLAEGEGVRHALSAGHKGWVQVARGAAELNGSRIEAGDGVAIEGPASLQLTGTADAELLLFDMA